MTNLREEKIVFNAGNKKTMTGSLRADWKGYHKIDVKLYPVKCTDTAYIPALSVFFGVTCALTKGFNVTPENKVYYF